ncbi:MAG: hypothetical protein ACLRFK_02450 [Alphaproteobacteria bacterium]
MKKIALTSLLIVLSLPTFAADFSAADFDAATTAAEAYAIYKTAAEKIIADAKTKGATKSELKDLQAIVDKVISEYTNVDAKKIETKELSTEEKAARIEAAQEKYDAAKEAEHSAENKLLGATTMMTTGMGAMELASSMSEQKADQEAEDQMRAYLSTFYCQYGSKRVPGGTKNAEVGGGNELINLYAEYVNLANDLKARKTALDIAPGIESEEILNSATAGLHDDESIGKRGSMFTSLARALQDPTGEDAQKWKAQQEESAKGIKDGATALGVGAVGSAVIDLAMNHIGDKDKDDEDKEEKELTDAEKSDLCEKGGLGKWDADNKTCTCDTDHATWKKSLVFNRELHICTTLTDKEVGDLNKKEKKELQTCNKSASKYVWNKTKKKCVDKPETGIGTDPKFAI